MLTQNTKNNIYLNICFIFYKPYLVMYVVYTFQFNNEFNFFNPTSSLVAIN